MDRGSIAGAVAAVMRDGQVVYLETVGVRDLEAGDAMPADALFRLYSMTRPITSAAAMILWEEGAFQLDDAVATYLPAFRDQAVLRSPDSLDVDDTRPRVGDITVEHLLLHTSGLGSRGSRLYRQEGVRDRGAPIERLVTNAARVPLFEDPGTRWRYGLSTSVLGRLVEVWSGQTLEEFLEGRLFTPLQMTDTVFWADETRVDRLARVYRPDADGRLRPHAIEAVPFTERPPLLEGGVGLLSTVRDYLRFCQMFLNGGELDGVRVLAPETVDLMTVNRVPPALLPLGGRPNGRGWTLGFSVVMDPGPFTFPGEPGHLLVGRLRGHPLLHRPHAAAHHAHHGAGVARVRQRLPRGVHDPGGRRDRGAPLRARRRAAPSAEGPRFLPAPRLRYHDRQLRGAA